MTNGLIRSFILNHFPLAKKVLIKDDDSLLESGIVDSLGILDIVNFIEKEFKISVSDEELLPENFESICALTAFVDRKRNKAELNL